MASYKSDFPGKQSCDVTPDINLTNGGVHAKISFIVFVSVWIVHGFLCMSGVGYVNNGNGTVTDSSTGLMWELKTNKNGVQNYNDPYDADNTYTWEQALSNCETSTLAGYSDWRLPTKKELRSLMDYSHYNPAINTTFFLDTVSSFYWSSTTCAIYTFGAWGMYFNYGGGYGGGYVRAVLGGQSGSLGNLVIAKFVDVPFMKVFVRIPQANGTVESLNYENVQTGETDATQIYFYVGRGNTDKAIRRVTTANLRTTEMLDTEDTYNPDYNESLQTKLVSPENFMAVFGDGSVQLNWRNTTHPNLSGVRIMRSSGTYPGSPANGTLVFEGSGTSFLDGDISQGLTYYYQAWSYDSNGGYSDPTSAMINTKVYSVFGKISLATSAGVGGATAALTDSAGLFVSSVQSGPDGAYAITNLEMNGYTLTVSHPSHEIENSVRTISLTQNAEVNFTATPIPTLNLLFDSPSVSINSMVSVPWAYRNIDNSSTLNIQLNRAGQWETIATNVPVLNGQIKWTATGANNEQLALRISLSSNALVYAEHAFVLVSGVVPGDINGDSVVDLKDAVIALQVLTGMLPEGSVNLAADVDGDGRIGISEVICMRSLHGNE